MKKIEIKPFTIISFKMRIMSVKGSPEAKSRGNTSSLMKFTGVKGDQCAVLTPPGETRVVQEGTAIYLQT